MKLDAQTHREIRTRSIKDLIDCFNRIKSKVHVFYISEDKKILRFSGILNEEDEEFIKNLNLNFREEE